MATRETATRPRAGLTRERILEAALRYIDERGVDALSMHKLGAELGVKGMSLYNHVANKDDVLDGVVVLLWAEVEATAELKDDWSDSLRSFAHALRAIMRRHPNAASLVGSQQIMPEPALRVVKAYADAAAERGIAEPDAHAILRTVNSYAMGSALFEVQWGVGGIGCAPSVSDLLRPGVSDELAALADEFCGKSDADAQFELGLDLMLRGLSSK
jgi:AcrR family transcriptional regulator